MLMGAPCPVVAGIQHGKRHVEFLAKTLELSLEEAKARDESVRLQIAEELGHGRIAITHQYLG